MDRVHDHLELCGYGLVPPVRVAVHEPRELVGACEAHPVRDGRISAQVVGQRLQPHGIGAGRTSGCLGDEDGADLELRGHVLIRREALVEIAEPGREAVRPRGNRVGVSTDGLEGDPGPPAIVVGITHGNLAPWTRRAVRTRGPVAEDDPHDVVPVHEGIGLDREDVADLPLDGETAAVELRRDVLDDRATEAVGCGPAG